MSSLLVLSSCFPIHTGKSSTFLSQLKVSMSFTARFTPSCMTQKPVTVVLVAPSFTSVQPQEGHRTLTPVPYSHILDVVMGMQSALGCRVFSKNCTDVLIVLMTFIEFHNLKLIIRK